MSTAEDLMNLLRARYPAPEYALFSQLANGTGGHFSRTADAVAMSLWPSRGLELLGFEVKVSRADWHRELRNPKKAESWVKICDRWYVVVADESIVQPGELPPTWGLMLPQRGKLKIQVEAPKLDPEPMTRPTLAALLRKVHSVSPAETALAAARSAGYQEGYSAGKVANNSKAARDLASVQLELNTLRDAVDEFELRSGVKIRLYDGGRLGDQVRAILDGGADRMKRELDGTVRAIERLYETAQALKARDAR